MRILAFETSCDETSVAVVEKSDNDIKVRSCETASSIAIHKKTGGIIPENAARAQIEFIIPTLNQSLKNAFPDLDLKDRKQIFSQIDAIAVTVGPGLVGSLLVGVETAKTLASFFDKPIIPINHIKAHIYAAWLNKEVPTFPLLALVVSGGHTDFVYLREDGSFKWVGGTRDDAAGECFDKCARLLGLSYPGGPAISKLAESFRNENPNFKLNLFPRPMSQDDTFDVSFSGLKTSVSNYLKANPNPSVQLIKQLSAEIEEAICETLVIKSLKVLAKFDVRSFVVCGGVSANSYLRFRLKQAVQLNEQNLELHVPQKMYCTDNAAMIGAAAFFNFKPNPWKDIDVKPELHF